ncbi:MAG: hypothetical protein R3176_09505 [Woeseiaceae bacterium]|nr:hypothetical protein [Woeseiaceae bacterium]
MYARDYRLVACILVLFTLGACSGGAGTNANSPPPAAASCDPADPATADECGTVLVGITDAAGDFLAYGVDVLGLTLETANGRTVEVLPRSTRVNFTDYVDLTELVTAATVPPATYVAGTIRLDYSAAEIFVEAEDAAKEAVVTDAGGTPLTETELRIRLSNRDQLTIVKGKAALLQLDFDLEASHAVDITPTPALAALEPFILAEVRPVDEKTIRVRGPLVEVDEDASTYTINVRPFLDLAGDFGRVTVHTDAETEFEVDGALFTGGDGLRALAAAGPGTPTVAKGILTPADRRFVADLVLAGSSVPGIDRDAVVGNVIARDGNFLTIRGATLILHDRRAHFHDDVVVEVGPDTKVFRDGHRLSDLSIRAISIGQRLTVYGSATDRNTDALAPQILFDATQGAVRLHVTHLLGTVNSIMPGELEMTLHAIDRRRAKIFDFAGTGMSPDVDADPAHYQVETGTLTLAALAEGRPVVAWGFPAAFGAAPPDFRGRTIIDYSDVRSTLGIGWGAAGTAAPFLRLGDDGIVLDHGNEDIGERHHIKYGPVLVDLLTLPSDTTIVPRESDRKLFAIASGDSLRQYAVFADFVADLALSLDGATRARSMFARGHYDRESNVLTAYTIGVFLIEPQ